MGANISIGVTHTSDLPFYVALDRALPSLNCSSDREREALLVTLCSIIASSSEPLLQTPEHVAFRFLYSRPATVERSDDNATASSSSSEPQERKTAPEQIMVSLVVIDVRSGRIVLKVQPRTYGTDRKEALQHFRKDIEMRMDRLLAGVASALPEEDTRRTPSQSPSSEDESTVRSVDDVPTGDLFDVAPPAYDKDLPKSSQ